MQLPDFWQGPVVPSAGHMADLCWQAGPCPALFSGCLRLKTQLWGQERGWDSGWSCPHKLTPSCLWDTDSRALQQRRAFPPFQLTEGIERGQVEHQPIACWAWPREMGTWALADKRPMFKSLLRMTLTLMPGLSELQFIHL